MIWISVALNIFLFASKSLILSIIYSLVSFLFLIFILPIKNKRPRYSNDRFGQRRFDITSKKGIALVLSQRKVRITSSLANSHNISTATRLPYKGITPKFKRVIMHATSGTIVSTRLKKDRC